MSEVLGDAEPFRDGDDFDDVDAIDEHECDDGLDGEPGAISRAISSVLTPGALAIASLVIATMTLFAALPTYIATPLVISHSQDPLFRERATAVAQLVAAAIAMILAVLAIRGSSGPDENERHLPRMLAGAALVIGAVSVLQAVIGVIVLAHTHLPGSFGFTSG